MKIIKTKKQLLSYYNKDNNRIEFNDHNVIIDFECLDFDKTIHSKFGIEFKFNFISAEHIKAGGHIEAGEHVFSFIFQIKIKTYLQTKKLPFYRDYYAEIFPDFSEIILNESFCWNHIKEEILKLKTKKQLKSIIEKSNQHWIIRAQLLMFFEIIDRFENKENK